MKVIYLNVNEKKEPEKLDIDENIDIFHNLIQCSIIDIVRRKIGKKFFRIICDDCGLLKDNPTISAIGNCWEIMLVGNLIITGIEDDEGNLTGLSEEEQDYIIQRIQKIATIKNPKGYFMLTQCEYY